MGRMFRNRVTGLLELILEITATEEWNAANPSLRIMYWLL